VLVGVAMIVAAMIAAVMIAPPTALGLDSADTISLSAPAGPNDAGYPFTFTGGGVVDGDTGGSDAYTAYVVWTPTSSPIFASGCPQDYASAAEAIDFADGDPDGVALDEGEAVLSDPTQVIGPYTYTATVNDEVVPILTTPGNYAACAYLMDDYSTVTYAVSPAPVPFSVVNPPGSATPPGGFGGPPSRRGHPSDLSLKVALTRRLRDPGTNILDVTGQFAQENGSGFLNVDLKSTRRYNGCASNDEQDEQITLSDGGAELAVSEQTTPNGDGIFRSPVAVRIKRRVPGTYVVCAYLNQDFADVAVGFDRITVPKLVTHKKRRHKR
jgi:hypothetical protein